MVTLWGTERGRGARGRPLPPLPVHAPVIQALHHFFSILGFIFTPRKPKPILVCKILKILGGSNFTDLGEESCFSEDLLEFFKMQVF